jgi:NAD(P)-dependent dehydrogenase (short-subunit alcohol dehydrogenase family)
MRSDRWNNPQQLAVLATALGLSLGALALRHSRRRRAFDFSGRSVLITGGSRGLGLVIARQVAAEGARITLVARDADELDRARQILQPAGGDITCIVGDVSKPADAERMVREVVERTGRIDVLINNAGVIKVGPLAHMDLADFDEAMAVHFSGPLHAMLTALPVMRRQGFGRIVNIASVGGQVAVPHLAPYCASKFALVGLSDSIRAEVARAGIYVTTVTPGLMRTGSPFNAWFKGQHRREFAWFTIADSLPAVTVSAETAAAVVVDACRHGDAHRAIGWTARVGAIANALAPNFVARNMAVMNDWLLPGTSEGGNAAHSGWQSLSGLAPSRLTRRTERAARQNNEVPAAPADDARGLSGAGDAVE